ncbi:MAG: hypothetical protein NTU44_08940 [Bacteroidetes bacterium]|nr:hypothetical protein [Bacteroidota bacterium]
MKTFSKLPLLIGLVLLLGIMSSSQLSAQTAITNPFGVINPSAPIPIKPFSGGLTFSVSPDHGGAANFMVFYHSDNFDPYELVLTDLAGKKVFSDVYKFGPGDHKIMENFSSIKPGTYIATMYSLKGIVDIPIQITIQF